MKVLFQPQVFFFCSVFCILIPLLLDIVKYVMKDLLLLKVKFDSSISNKSSMVALVLTQLIFLYTKPKGSWYVIVGCMIVGVLLCRFLVSRNRYLRKLTVEKSKQEPSRQAMYYYYSFLVLFLLELGVLSTALYLKLF